MTDKEVKSDPNPLRGNPGHGASDHHWLPAGENNSELVCGDCGKRQNAENPEGDA